MKKKKNYELSFYDTYSSIRRSWNGVPPCTKIIPNKKKKRPRESKYKTPPQETNEA